MLLQILSVRPHGFKGGRGIQKQPAYNSRGQRSFGNIVPYAKSLNSEATIYFTLHRSRSNFTLAVISPTCGAGRSWMAVLSRAVLFASSHLLRRCSDASLTKVRHLQRVQRNLAVGTNRHGHHSGRSQSIHLSLPWISPTSMARRTLFFPAGLTERIFN